MAEVEGFDLAGFGERVKARRTELGMTQPALGGLAGADETAVRRWENGTLPRDADTLARLATALRVSVTWLLGDQRDLALLDGARAAINWMRLTLQEQAEAAERGSDEFYADLAVADGAIRGKSMRTADASSEPAPPQKMSRPVRVTAKKPPSSPRKQA